MITKKAQKAMVWQLRAVKALTGANYFHWDTKQNKFVEQHGYIRFNSNCLVATSFVYPVILFLWLLYKRSDEEGLGSGIDFTSHVIGWVELSLVIVCQGMSYRLATHVAESILLINQLFQHSDYIHDMMIKRQLEFDSQRKRKIQTSESLVYFAFFAFIVVPPSMAIMITIPWEPNHAMIKDILEIDVKLQMSHLPCLIVITWFAINIGGVLQLVSTMVVASLQIVDVCISCMVPQNVNQLPTKRGGIQYEIETESWGLMTDDMIILHVRSLQIVNLLMNKIYASVMISSHHFCFLVIFVGVSYILIKMPGEIIAGGLIACAFIGCFLILPVFAQYTEADLVGKHVQDVEMFLNRCKTMTKRRSLFWKTIASVPRIRVELLYPYGSVKKATFLQFIHNGLDNLIALLAL